MFEPVTEICQHAIEQHGNILTTLFVAGVVGGFTHCAGMCGPFVMAQTTARLERVSADGMSEWQRLRGAALLPYHLGRMTAYAAMGAAGGFLAQTVVVQGGFSALNGVLLMLAGVLFIATGIHNTNLARFLPSLPRFSGFQNMVSSLSRPLFADPRGARGYVLGLLLGFLPCGLLYSALFLSSAYPPVVAAMGMALFAAGTSFALFAVSWGTLQAGRRFRTSLVKLGQILMIANGALLLVLAGRKFFA